ncbi:hypothetical protein F5884DRAFT_879629 [Xylogone sp. PMI_703]|nr:hypothetical protein F5884DRAFT_879629 [Xylogone sp. PMI_703]
MIFSFGLAKRTRSPLWHRALERYREELEETDDYQEIIEVKSLDDLLDYTRTFESLLPNEQPVLSSLSRLGPTLRFVDDFSALIALYFGADTKLTGLVWGSIRMMLSLASSVGDTLQDVLAMLEELSLYAASTLPMDRALEAALLDVYTEVICFYARAIHFFHSHPHVLLRRSAWEEFRTDFSKTIRRIKRLSSTVEKEADITRMRSEKTKYKEVLELMDDIKKTKVDDGFIQCYHVPFELNPRFWGREDALSAVQDVLNPLEKPNTLKTFALYGMGGVGKTQIALQYANRHRQKYDVVLWVATDNTISMGQSFRDIAGHLKLVENDEDNKDPVAATLKVKEWLRDTNAHWLLIFDNADDIEVLRLAWPGNSYGNVLLTTRDFNVVHGPSSAGFHVQPFNDATGSDMLLQIVGLDTEVDSNIEKATDIVRALGGLPLALNQIGGFISQRKLPLQDFLPLYERNAAKIDARKTTLTGYEHTLSTVWAMSIGKLSGDSLKLINLLALLEPDSLHESVLVEGSKLLIDEDFQFLNDEMDLGDAEEVLLKAALIEKSIDDAVLSIHRLVQAAIVRGLKEDERSKYFDVIVRILSWGFPDTRSEDVGHQFHAWAKCEKCLPHVNHLVKQAKRYNIATKDPQLYGELLLRCSWYLYEREWYDVAGTLAQVALETFQDKKSLAYASAVDLSGLINLDLNRPEIALPPFQATLEIREEKLGSQDPLIASSLNNIALAYTEMGELDKAYDFHNKAIKIRIDTKSDRIGNSYSNMSSLLLRMGKPDAAEEMLKRCPSLREFTDDTFLRTGNPRFSGDMVLLSRIRLQQGRLDDAMRLATKALNFRQNLLGNRLKTCDSLYDVSSLLYRQGNLTSAIELLKELVAISETLNEGEGQLARANYKLAILYQEKGAELESEQCKNRAVTLMKKIGPEGAEIPFEEAEYMKLCLWMLW